MQRHQIGTQALSQQEIFKRKKAQKVKNLNIFKGIKLSPLTCSYRKEIKLEIYEFLFERNIVQKQTTQKNIYNNKRSNLKRNLNQIYQSNITQVNDQIMYNDNSQNSVYNYNSINQQQQQQQQSQFIQNFQNNNNNYVDNKNNINNQYLTNYNDIINLLNADSKGLRNMFQSKNQFLAENIMKKINIDYLKFINPMNQFLLPSDKAIYTNNQNLPIEYEDKIENEEYVIDMEYCFDSYTKKIDYTILDSQNKVLKVYYKDLNVNIDENPLYYLMEKLLNSGNSLYKKIADHMKQRLEIKKRCKQLFIKSINETLTQQQIEFLSQNILKKYNNIGIKIIAYDLQNGGQDLQQILVNEQYLLNRDWDSLEEYQQQVIEKQAMIQLNELILLSEILDYSDNAAKLQQLCFIKKNLEVDQSHLKLKTNRKTKQKYLKPGLYYFNVYKYSNILFVCQVDC